MSLLIPTLAGKDPTDHVVPWNLHIFEAENVFGTGFNFYITNQMVMSLAAGILVCMVFFIVSLRMGKAGSTVESYVTKGRFAQLFEVILEFIRNEVAKPALGKSTDRYIYYVWSLFFFILFCNLLGLFPLGYLLAFIDYFAVGMDPSKMNKGLPHWSGTATGNFWIVATLGLCSFFMIHFSGIRESGFKYWAMHFLPGPFYLWPLMLPLEIIGAVIKPIALTIRLFANMVAGHLILAALVGMILTYEFIAVPFVVPGALAILLLKLFVSFLQAYIFTFLTVLFMSAFLHDEDHDHDEEHHHEEDHGHSAVAGEAV